MLSGQAEVEESEAMRRLMIHGREYHKDFADELYETTHLDPGYVWDGALRTATDERSHNRLLREHSVDEHAGLPIQWLTRAVCSENRVSTRSPVASRD